MRDLYKIFSDNAQLRPDAVALVVDGIEHTYSELQDLVRRIGALMVTSGPVSDSFVGIFAHRSLSAFAGVLGALSQGAAYVPLSPKFPPLRNRFIAEASGMRTIVVGNESLPEAIKLLDTLPTKLTLIFPQTSRDDLESWEALNDHQIFTMEDLDAAPTAIHAIHPHPSARAYMLFTSGTTGNPKGVPIRHEQVLAYLDFIIDQYPFDEDDRFSQTFDLTFDLSVHDMFVCWAVGGRLYVLPEQAVMAPARFIRENRLTVWFSVPSVGYFMSRLRMLKPGAFPHLKMSLFCGEALPEKLVKEWRDAATHSSIVNLYGPTEATIAITHYRCPGSPSDSVQANNGIVSIGRVFESQSYRVVDESLRSVNPGKQGELCVSGSQVGNGYWKNPEKTKQQFVHLPGEVDRIWYRTGDLVRLEPDGNLAYLGRIDFQIKIQGHRVELDEINRVVEAGSGAHLAVSVPYPIRDGTAEGIYCFIDTLGTASESEALDYCRNALPGYMVPRRLLTLGNFPLNANGKIDRNKLAQLLEESRGIL